MSLYIYNSLARKKEEFKPLSPAQAKMYVCGPTVYDEPHIGHARSAYIFDVIRRYLIYKGYKVTFVRNVTDVDDKIIEKARNEYKGEDLNSAVKKVADKYLTAYHEALESLGIATQSPDVIEPKASEYIDKMIVFIKGLIDKGAAYQAGRDVYFDIAKAENYGKLSHQALDKMEAGARVAPLENKKNPLDFALWKSAKEGEPSWDSPYGKGRPGWHIECSVMSSDILGDEFDIHGGGLDLIFPHHENEIAQSEGAGKNFARIWMHHGLLTINGQKMAKSLGNFVTIKDFIAKYPADVLKLFFLQTHYSQPIDFTWERMEEKKSSLETIITFLEEVKNKEEGKDFAVKAVLKKSSSPEDLRKEINWYRDHFEKSMDDDFNTPNAIAVLFEIVRTCNKVLYSTIYTKQYLPILKDAKEIIQQLGHILGISFILRKSVTITTDTFIISAKISDPNIITEKQEQEIKGKLLEREKARREKNYVLADTIRKELEENGIILEDKKL